MSAEMRSCECRITVAAHRGPRTRVVKGEKSMIATSRAGHATIRERAL
jgi:hypothetical protein